MTERFPLKSQIFINDKYVGEIFAYGSDDDESYLVKTDEGELAVTNRELLDSKNVQVVPWIERRHKVE